jgi:hypothetical protein
VRVLSRLRLFGLVQVTNCMLKLSLPFGLFSKHGARELRICPFCRFPGGVQARQLEEDGGLWTVFCDQLFCPVNPTSKPFTNRQEAINNWNSLGQTPFWGQHV